MTWRLNCIKVGCRPERCANPKTIVSTKGRYQIVCPNCGKTYNAYRLGKRMKVSNRYRCGVCQTENLGWTDTHTNLPVYQPIMYCEEDKKMFQYSENE